MKKDFQDDKDLISNEEKLVQTLEYVSILEKKCDELNNQLDKEKDLERKIFIYETIIDSFQDILKHKSLEINVLKKELDSYKQKYLANKKEINYLNIRLNGNEDKYDYLRENYLQLSQDFSNLKEEYDNNLWNRIKFYFKR
ncbi:hypothetical protein [uncultured Methanobrevibacter sp.]|uniref:hypothetical protein n=1 Tax=uncultured Methanobrevibacter sp. TaxID=253161 RepID=UPI0025E8C7C6|nr:hypothetical protein [uncultured Methanobrevibacter sp.]